MIWAHSIVSKSIPNNTIVVGTPAKIIKQYNLRQNIGKKYESPITGGAGFIGSHIALRLIEKGYDVTVLDNLLAQIRGIILTRLHLCIVA